MRGIMAREVPLAFSIEGWRVEQGDCSRSQNCVPRDLMPQGNSHIFEVRSQALADGKELRLAFCKICGGQPGKTLNASMSIQRSLTSDCCGSMLTSEQITGLR